MLNFGINPRKTIEGIKGTGWYLKDFNSFRKQLRGNPEFKQFNLHPILGNRFQQGGTASGHYFHQDLYMAQKIYEAKPDHHLDIGSRVDGFIAHLAVFMQVEVMDIRHMDNQVSNIKYIQADLSSSLFSLANYTSSISCLHAIEHFGLGRYGDPIDANGYVTGLDNIYKCLKNGGTFYFSTPMGPSRIEFNAHRVFSLTYLLSLLKDKYEILSFAYVDDAGDLHTNVDVNDSHASNNFGCVYGCALFELKKTGK